MKDFTKTQESSKAVSLKCNTCNSVVKAFGIDPGDPCAGNSRVDADLGRPGPHISCNGKYMAFDGRAADAIKRRTDGAA